MSSYSKKTTPTTSSRFGTLATLDTLKPITYNNKKTSTTYDITKAANTSAFEFTPSYDFTFKSEPTTPEQRRAQVVNSNRNFRQADSENMKQTEQRQQRQRVAETRTNMHTVEKPAQKSRSLSEFSMGLSKSERYRQIASNLSTLAGNNLRTYEEKSGAWDTYNKVLPGVTAVATAINPWLGAGVALVGGLANLFNNSGDYKEKAQLYSNMNESITKYLTNLTNRDTTIMNTMDQIYSSMDNLRGTYGTQFVDTMYNYYLAKSGMTSDAYSLLTGNFETFEDIGSGRVSSENGIFDTLTDGNQALFNNVYAQITLEDITGNKNLLDSMVQSLYGANTEFGMQLREYENELRTVLINSREQTSQLLFQGRNELVSQYINARSENISAAEQIAEAEANSASSGLRGGTTGNNAALARLSRDLGQIQRTANTASLLGTLKYNVLNAQKNASATAYSYRNAQRKAVIGALNENVSSWNEIGRTSKGGERSANYYLTESQSYQKQFMEDFNEVAEKDKDKIFAATT